MAEGRNACVIGAGFGGVAGEQLHRRGVAGRAQRLDLGNVFRIHAQDQVEPGEIGGGELPRAQIAQVRPHPLLQRHHLSAPC